MSQALQSQRAGLSFRSTWGSTKLGFLEQSLNEATVTIWATEVGEPIRSDESQFLSLDMDGNLRKKSFDADPASVGVLTK